MIRYYAEDLRRPEQAERERVAQQVAQLHSKGYSQRKIAAQLKLRLATVNRMVTWANIYE